MLLSDKHTDHFTRTSRAPQVADALSGDGAASAAVDAELARRAEADGGGARFARADASRARRRLLRAILASAFLREHADAAAVVAWVLEAYGELEAGASAPAAREDQRSLPESKGSRALPCFGSTFFEAGVHTMTRVVATEAANPKPIITETRELPP